MCLLNNWVYPILQSVFGAYFLILIVKLFALRMIHRFFGNFKHIVTNDVEKDSTNFRVSYQWKTFFNPIPNISIKIQRKNNTDTMDWNGVFNSDILNPYYFKGLYIIDKPGPNDED